MAIQRSLSIGALALALVAAGCGSDTSVAPASLPATTAAATTTSTTIGPIAATPSAGEATVPAFPVTVTDDTGPKLVEAAPQRVVSLSATHTEMLYAIGAGPQIAATDLTSNYPAEALETPKLDSFNFNVEEVAALDPDLVVIAFDFQDEAEQLAALDIPFLLLSAPATLEGMFDQLMVIGEATGHAPAATALSAELRAELEDLEARSGPLEGVTFFHEIDETLFTTTSASFLGDLYSRLGLANIADGAGGENQFPQLSPEYILEQDPMLVFLGDAGFGVTVESVAARPGWAALTAVANGDVIPLDGDVSGRWGPRTIALMAQILEAALEAVS